MNFKYINLKLKTNTKNFLQCVFFYYYTIKRAKIYRDTSFDTCIKKSNVSENFEVVHAYPLSFWGVPYKSNQKVGSTIDYFHLFNYFIRY